MKSSIILLFVLGLFFTTRAQETFTVIKVVGIVQNQQLNRHLKTGDKLQTKDALQFSSKNSYIILIGPKSGRKIIRDVPDNSPHEFYQLLQTFVKPDRKSAATRSGTYIEKLKQQFAYDTLVILGDGRISIEDPEFISAPAGIRVIYKEGDKHVYRKISDDNSFSINKASLFDSKVPNIIPRISLYYYEDEKENPAFNQGVRFAELVPLFMDEQLFKTEIEAIVESLRVNKLSQKDLVKEIKDYIEAEYGGTIDENLRNWLTNNQVISK